MIASTARIAGADYLTARKTADALLAQMPEPAAAAPQETVTTPAAPARPRRPHRRVNPKPDAEPAAEADTEPASPQPEDPS